MAGNGQDTALLQAFAPALELRLEEDERLAALGQDIFYDGKNELQRNKAEVGDDPVHGERKIILFEIPRVGVVHHHNAGIGGKGRSKLAFPHIHADDRPCAALQKAIRKPPRTGAEVAVSFARNVLPKDIQPAGELIAAVGDILLLGERKLEIIPFLHLIVRVK